MKLFVSGFYWPTVTCFWYPCILLAESKFVCENLTHQLLQASDILVFDWLRANLSVKITNKKFHETLPWCRIFKSVSYMVWHPCHPQFRTLIMIVIKFPAHFRHHVLQFHKICIQMERCRKPVLFFSVFEFTHSRTGGGGHSGRPMIFNRFLLFLILRNFRNFHLGYAPDCFFSSWK